MIDFLVFFADAFELPHFATPNFADPLGYNQREQLYGGINTAGFGDESLGAFGLGTEPVSGVNNYGQYNGFARNNPFVNSYGYAAFGPVAHNGNNMYGERTSVTSTPIGSYTSMNYYTAINQSFNPFTGDDRTANQEVKAEENDDKASLFLAEKDSRDD